MLNTVIPVFTHNDYTFAQVCRRQWHSGSISSHPGLGPQACVAHWTGVDHILARTDKEWDQADAKPQNRKGQAQEEEQEHQEPSKGARLIANPGVDLVVAGGAVDSARSLPCLLYTSPSPRDS